MDPFQSFSSQFNPQLYESSNVPPSTDKLFSFSGFQAGLMTNNANIMSSPSSSQQPLAPSQSSFVQPMIQRQPKPPTPQGPFPDNTMESGNTRYSGMYANTGFDMLSILSRVANR